MAGWYRMPAPGMKIKGEDPLLPEERKRKGDRALRVVLRTVHLLGFSVLFGGHWFGLPRAELLPWLYWTVFSGAGLAALELRAGLDWALQLAGGLVLVKVVLLALVPAYWELRVALLAAVMVIGSVGSHMPAALRHFYWFRPGAASARQ